MQLLPNKTDASVVVGPYPTIIANNTAPVVQAYYASKWVPRPENG